MWLLWLLVILIGIPIGLMVAWNLLKLAFALLCDISNLITGLIIVFGIYILWAIFT